MSTLKETAKHSAIYSMGNLAVKMAGLLLLPIITENLDLSEYGSYTLIESFNQIFVAILSIRLPIAALRLASAKPEASQQKAMFTHALLILLAVSLGISALAWALQNPLSTLLTGETGRTRLIVLVAASVITEILGLVPVQYLRLKDRSITFVTLSISKLVVLVAMVYWLVEVKDWGIEGVVASFLAGHLTFLIGALIFLYRRPEPYSVNTGEMKALFHYGWPLVFTSVITVLLATSDRFIIRHFHDFADIGIYGISAKLAGIVNFVILNAFFIGYTSIAFRKHEEREFMNLQPTIIRFISLLVMAAIWFLSLFSETILEILTRDDDYVLAYLYVPYFGIIIGFTGLQNFLALAFHFTRKTRQNIPIVAVALVVNIVLALILVPIHPVYGALGSSILSMLAMLIMTFHNSTRIYHDFAGLRNLIRILFVIVAGAVVCVVAIHWAPLESLWLRAVLYVVMIFVAMKVLRINTHMVFRTLRSWF